jgi:hypothetical protein
MSFWRWLTGCRNRGRGRDFEEVETFVSKWPFLDVVEGPYDFNGVMFLFLAALKNLSTNSIEADFEDFSEFGQVKEGGLFTPKQREFLRSLIEMDRTLLTQTPQSPNPES